MRLHVIAETAQHAGHADIIRESLDGAKTMGQRPPLPQPVDTTYQRQVRTFILNAAMHRSACRINPDQESGAAR
jgi:hypothetical protein